MKEAESEITDPVWRDELSARRLYGLGRTGGPRSVVEAAGPLLARATGAALAFACLPASSALTLPGRIGRVLDTTERGRSAQDAVSELAALDSQGAALSGAEGAALSQVRARVAVATCP